MSEEKSPLRDPRIANLDLVEVCREGSETFSHEQIDNISRSGLFIRTNKPYPIGTKVSMRFTIVTKAKEDEYGDPKIFYVEVAGKVVRVVRSRIEPSISGPGMGVKFLNLDPKATQLIDEIVIRRLENTPTIV